MILILACGCSASAPTEDLEPLFRTLDQGTPAQAFDASEMLAALYDDSCLSLLEKALEVVPARALQLIGDLPTEGSAALLLRRFPGLLESKEPEVVRMAIVAAGLRKLRGATALLLERAEDPAAMRALGRIWAQPLEAPPLPRRDEIDRLTVLALSHRQAMGGTTSVEACETMLATMTRSELAEFLGKHAAERFFARRPCDEAVRRRGFDPGKGLLVHEALLSNPDVDLVAAILESSPFPLPEDLVRGFLNDERFRAVAARRLKRRR
jgi:hypothetical protein